MDTPNSLNAFEKIIHMHDDKSNTLDISSIPFFTQNSTINLVTNGNGGSNLITSRNGSCFI